MGEVTEPTLPRKTSKHNCQVPVPQTDSGRWVEYTKALEITLVKELGKLAP